MSYTDNPVADMEAHEQERLERARRLNEEDLCEPSYEYMEEMREW